MIQQLFCRDGTKTVSVRAKALTFKNNTTPQDSENTVLRRDSVMTLRITVITDDIKFILTETKMMS